ncbi:hypothetical protein H4W00_001813 [Psychrobacter sp. PL19]|uniref:hypothetical protein n=1 Tax=Psychrobacter sp. PL19 TaxID=2760711 RepID=UPI001AE889AC
MPLRPIDAIFVHPEQRLYVVYYRGALWQLPRMKIDNTSWQRRQPYNGSKNALYLSSHQAIVDPILALKLRTLDLPAAIRGITVPRFEAWWETHGFDWLKNKLTASQSPLAAHAKMSGEPFVFNLTHKPNLPSSDNSQTSVQVVATDIFTDMLADLADEVMQQPL